MKVYERVARALRTGGVEHVFGLMGDANLRHLVSYIDHQGGDFVSALAEGGAVSMADGYARVGDTVGVASVTHGPGLTNTLTALTEAVRARSRVVVLTGSTPSRPDHLQRLDIRAAVAVTGADYVRVLSPERAESDVLAALARVRVTECPVVVDVPVDIEDAEVDGPAASSMTPTGPPGPNPDDLDRALGIIASARRPVILAGRGAIAAREELLALARLIGAPVATTLLAKGLFRGERHDLGVVGNVGHPLGVETAWRSDCVIVFGAGLNRYTTLDGSLLQGRSVVQVDLRAERLGALTAPTAAVVADARLTALAMAQQLSELGESSAPWYDVRLIEAMASRDPLAENTTPSADGTVDPRLAMAVLDGLLPRQRVVVTDTGRFVYAPWQHLGVTTPTDFAHTLSFASIGLGIATAIGAAVARPGRPTVAVVGDGGGMMGMGELTTAVRLGLPLLVVVCNDSAYGMEHRALLRSGLDPRHSLLTWPGFAGVARGYGARGALAHTLDELRAAAAAWVADPGGPYVIDLRTDPTLDITP